MVKLSWAGRGLFQSSRGDNFSQHRIFIRLFNWAEWGCRMRDVRWKSIPFFLFPSPPLYLGLFTGWGCRCVEDQQLALSYLHCIWGTGGLEGGDTSVRAHRWRLQESGGHMSLAQLLLQIGIPFAGESQGYWDCAGECNFKLKQSCEMSETIAKYLCNYFWKVWVKGDHTVLLRWIVFGVNYSS